MTITVTNQHGETTTDDVVESKEEVKSAPDAKAPEQKDVSESGTDQKEESKEQKDDSEESEVSETEPKEKSEDEEKDDDDDKEAAKEKPKKKGGFQRRIDKLNAKMAAKEAEAEHWKREALKKGATDPKESEVEEKPESKADGKPNADDFEDHSEFVEALADWKADEKIRQYEERQAKTKMKSDQDEKLNSHFNRVKSFAETTEDFSEVLEGVDDIQASATVQEVIVSSENGPELMYELAKQRNEYARICALSPLAAARELGKFEASLNAKPSQETRTEKKITKAPSPISPVGTKTAKVEKSIYDSNLTQREYEALRAKQRSARA